MGDAGRMERVDLLRPSSQAKPMRAAVADDRRACRRSACEVDRTPRSWCARTRGDDRLRARRRRRSCRGRRRKKCGRDSRSLVPTITCENIGVAPVSSFSWGSAAALRAAGPPTMPRPWEPCAHHAATAATENGPTPVTGRRSVPAGDWSRSRGSAPRSRGSTAARRSQVTDSAAAQTITASIAICTCPARQPRRCCSTSATMPRPPRLIRCRNRIRKPLPISTPPSTAATQGVELLEHHLRPAASRPQHRHQRHRPHGPER